MDIKNQIQRIIDKRKQKLTKEIDEYETKMRDTESYLDLADRIAGRKRQKNAESRS